MEDNKTVCQDDCDFSEYDYTQQKAKCSCKVKESSSESIADMKINTSKLYDNFIDIKNIANIKLMNCYKELFTVKGIKQNIAFYTTIPIIIFHTITIIMFYTNKKKKIFDQIEDIIFGINHWELVKEEKRRRKMKKRSRNNNKNKKINMINTKKEKKVDKTEKRKEKEENKDDYYLNEISKENQNPPKKNRRGIKLNINNNFNNINNITENKKDMGSKIFISNESTLNQTIIKKTKKIMAYNDNEINNLRYKLALKFDKRTYCQYYISLLKTNHSFIFSFFNNTDYNSKIIKIDLFFISFSIHYSVNALFFNDNTMHKIYEDEGSFNFIDQLPQIVYSSLISAALNILLQLLALSESNIIDYKKDKNRKNLDERKLKLNNRLKIKFFLYFILGFIFLFIFWYYLSMFCAIYRNTQYHLIKDTLISFLYH